MLRPILLFVMILAGLLALGSWVTPWWVFPLTSQWKLEQHTASYVYCAPVGDTLQLLAGRYRASLFYRSDEKVARALRRFRWRVLPPSDSFWLAQAGSIKAWKGRAAVDAVGRFVGESEGLVAVEVSEGSTHGAIVVMTVLPPFTFSAQPATVSVPTGSYADVELTARFADGTLPPASYERPVVQPVGASDAVTTNRRLAMSRGSRYSPWWTVVRPLKNGTQRLQATYLTRRIEIPVTGLPSDQTGPVTVSRDSLSEKSLRPPSDSERAREPVRWRDRVLTEGCANVRRLLQTLSRP